MFAEHYSLRFQLKTDLKLENPRLGEGFLKSNILMQRKNKNKQSIGSQGKLLFHTKLVSRIFKLKLGFCRIDQMMHIGFHR